MAQPDGLSSEPSAPAIPSSPGKPGFIRRLFARNHGSVSSGLPELQPSTSEDEYDDPAKHGARRRSDRKVVAGLPRAQTFKRQQSESRAHLAPVEPTQDERRAVSVDRRSQAPHQRDISAFKHGNPRTSAPGFFGTVQDELDADHPYLSSVPDSYHEDDVLSEKMVTAEDFANLDSRSFVTDSHSMSTSKYDEQIREELETIWILNLSMHFKDRSKREKFFVTYREQEHLWRRVTLSLDYRDAPPNSLEEDLTQTTSQREKNAKIYEAIRESLPDIQFYETVTNLKLQTSDGRLHVHVVEDGNEIISYPRIEQFRHINCQRIKEQDIDFDSHMSGFVYKVNVQGQVFIKKEIPSPETVEEFLYEVNALNRLSFSDSVIHFCGIVVDDYCEEVKGLLVSYAEQGQLLDIIYERCKETRQGIPWPTKERWARQIVQGLADAHDSGFVQGDFTLSNIVLDDRNDAKIIDINRRGCPIGWEPPEAGPLLDSGLRISMYIGVKSDLFQLGMVLWALAMDEDEPESRGRPLTLESRALIPDWYRKITEICLSEDPRQRLEASRLLAMFPVSSAAPVGAASTSLPISVDDRDGFHHYVVDVPGNNSHPVIRTVEPRFGTAGPGTKIPEPYVPYEYPRGRSPPSPLPSHLDQSESFIDRYNRSTWSAKKSVPRTYNDVERYEEPGQDEESQQPTPTPTTEMKNLLIGDETDHRASQRTLQSRSDLTGAKGTYGEGSTRVQREALGVEEVLSSEDRPTGLRSGEPSAYPRTGERADGTSEEDQQNETRHAPEQTPEHHATQDFPGRTEPQSSRHRDIGHGTFSGNEEIPSAPSVSPFEVVPLATELSDAKTPLRRLESSSDQSLTGVGGHLDEKFLRDTSIDEADFMEGKQPEAIPTVTITTEPKM